MKKALQEIREQALVLLEKADDLAEIEEMRIRYLGRRGEITNILKQMGRLAPEERPTMGAFANEVRATIEATIDEKTTEIKTLQKQKRLREETLDVTMPGIKNEMGHMHPLTIVQQEIEEIFLGMGFDVVEGPEIESAYYNFEALNIPEDHPARDLQDTFYISEEMMLRSQTSPVQVRTMEERKPPLRIIAPGRVYRSDDVDATHSPVFHQIEGLVIDKNVTMADLKGTLEIFAKTLYGEDAVVRFRPHHFQFTEPSAEMDTQCHVCKGKGCRICKYEGWIELLGCGMVHPKVLRYGGIDPEVYSGFAFGMGLERMVMRRFEIDDLRLFYENNLRFLSQF